jgi:hypothetical protein
VESESLSNVCASIDELGERFFCRYREHLSFYTAETQTIVNRTR